MPTSTWTARLRPRPISMPSTTMSPAVVLFELVDAADQRRLARAGGPDDADHLALPMSRSMPCRATKCPKDFTTPFISNDGLHQRPLRARRFSNTRHRRTSGQQHRNIDERRADERRRIRGERLRLRRLLQEVRHGDDRRKGRVLHDVDGIGRDRRNDDLQCLGQDNVDHHEPPWAQTHRMRGLELAVAE